MNIEIERKFLLADDTWRALVSRSVRIRDGILAFYDGRKIRIRFYGQKATLTVKGPRKGLARDEFEYDIPQALQGRGRREDAPPSPGRGAGVDH